jgi:phosphoribosylaminoimidazole-succinocarboxamide synthase
MPTDSIPPPDYTLPPGYTHVYSGKVRDLWRTPDDNLLFVATDRISAYDWVLPTVIPDKGKILTATTLWWFEQLASITGNHLISTDVPAQVAGRAMVCTPLTMVPVECVARGYLTGSGLSDYQHSGTVCGVPLPEGLVDGSRLPEAIFTPATKAAIGDHDENISFTHMQELVGEDVAEQLRTLTLAIYRTAEAIARDRGILLADTKLEFGFDATGQLLLADEVLTPDSSRYWPADQWQPGRPQPSFDKQYVRDWLTSPASGWNRQSDTPPPPLPDDVVERTRAKYLDVYERLTGQSEL